MISRGFILALTISVAAAKSPAAYANSTVNESKSVAFVPRETSLRTFCSNGPANSSMGNGAPIAKADLILVRSWLGCLQAEAAEIDTEASAQSSVDTATAIRLRQLAAQLKSSSVLAETMLNQSFRDKAAGASAGAQTVATSAIGSIHLCQAFTALQGGVGTVTAATLNSNSGGEKATYSILNAALPVIGALIACTTTQTNNAQNAVNSAPSNPTNAPPPIKTLLGE